MSEVICSVARLLNKSDCNSGKGKVKKCFTVTKDITELSEFQKDLLLFRSGLPIDCVSDVCAFHQHFFAIDNEEYFYGVKKETCNPFRLHETVRKGRRVRFI